MASKSTLTNVEARWVVGYEGLYSVTRDGRVWSHIRRKWMRSDCSRGNRYHYIQLRKNNKPKFTLLSHIVLTAYVGPQPPGHLGLHKNDNKNNNRLDNLEWGTHQQNMINMVHLR